MVLRECIITTPNEILKFQLYYCFSMLFCVLRAFHVPFSYVTYYRDKYGNEFISAPGFELCVCIPNLSNE